MSTDRFPEFRALHHGGTPLLLPNAWDHASGAALAAAGFAAVGTTSLGVAAAAGKPDAAGGTRAETLTLARRLGTLPVPVTVDVEGGFSEHPGEVAELAAELASFGIAGVNIEDGRSDGSLAPRSHLAEVVAAVKAAAPRLFVNARTDTFWLAGGPDPLREAVARTQAYAAAGADGVFVPGVADPGDVRTLVRECGVPLNVLFLPGRHTLDDLAGLGVARVSTGSLLFRTALHAAVAAAVAVREGTAEADPAVPSYADVQRMS
jgi:2-methylisocitrate lyase-like PEP mutase family enzyme